MEVLDYSPMPGQFVNELPEIAPNADAVAVRRAVQQSLDRGSLICLGGFGGSVTLRLKTPILHSPQAQGDFRVLGNAFYWGTSTYD
ncbi:MAG TPA: PKD domain-containing protein, partial [Muribaculaceae bacterium]|nr:PKD domain-containing protein [Muribaculaceae bacterium]